MTKALLVLNYPENLRSHYADRLRRTFPDLIVDVVEHHSKASPYIGEADILLTFATMASDSLLAAARKLKWIQILGTGTDGVSDSPALPAGVMVTNIRGIQGAAMSEAALAAMLAVSRSIPKSVRYQDQQSWERWPTKLLRGKTLGILGVGAIAGELAPRAKAMGMTVVGISKSPRELASFDYILPRARLVEIVAEVDYLVILAPYSSDTERLINERVLAAMKPTAYLINLARGGIVDEVALADALTRGRLAGAALDVFDKEPLPSGHALWSVPNLLITAHLGGFHDGYADDVLPMVTDNMQLFLDKDFRNMKGLVTLQGGHLTAAQRQN